MPKEMGKNGASQPKKPGEMPPASMTKLPDAFYHRPGVRQKGLAKDLLGKVLVTNFDGERTAGRIVEVEAYNGVVDKASHAWSGRRTKRRR